jgi:hypothetical protein
VGGGLGVTGGGEGLPGDGGGGGSVPAQFCWLIGRGVLQPGMAYAVHAALVICWALGQPGLCRDQSMRP